MNAQRWQQIEALFPRLLEAAEGEREALLDAECGDDAELRLELASLVAAATPDAGQLIREVVAGEAAHLTTQAHAHAVGRRVGPYRVRSLLGEGGMGAVYLASRDDAQFTRDVAIKILPRALGTTQAIARFRDERQILAALEHRNIVRLLDGGSTDDHLPYLVMEYIEGQPITAYARERRLSIRARVELVYAVCGAIQYAHQNLIVHRDIKPSNILVDAEGTPKLLDFGIAKLLAPVAAFEREAKTRTGHMMFTPEYASPEQIRGGAVSTATDVYSLGAVLYELVTGQPPLPRSNDMLELLRTLAERGPVRPSLAVPRDQRRELVGDLDNIILKALHEDPARRYASIERFADDLRRHLDGLPVQARLATLGYRARKFVLRNKATVIASALAVATLLGATLIALQLAHRADQHAERADAEAARARAEEVRAREQADRAQREAERARRAEHEVQIKLDELAVEHSARTAAETEARKQTTDATMSREQLEVALAKANREKQLAEEESARARDAERRAARAREDAEALYEREKARVHQYEQQEKKISTQLR